MNSVPRGGLEVAACEVLAQVMAASIQALATKVVKKREVGFLARAAEVEVMEEALVDATAAVTAAESARAALRTGEPPSRGLFHRVWLHNSPCQPNHLVKHMTLGAH